MARDSGHSGPSVRDVIREAREKTLLEVVQRLQQARQAEWSALQEGHGVAGWEAVDTLCAWAIDRLEAVRR